RSAAPPQSATPVAAQSPAPSAAPEVSTVRRSTEPPRVCGRKPGERIERVPWGHGRGNAKCDALETLWANVPHADRACHSDDECTVVSSDGNCIRLPLTKVAAGRAEYQT